MIVHNIFVSFFQIFMRKKVKTAHLQYTGHGLFGGANGSGLFDSNMKIRSGLSGATKPLVS